MNALAPYRSLTIKIGSALLVDKSGKLRSAWLAGLAEDIAALKANGCDVVVVSSGAIALGRGLLGLDAISLTLEQSQAAASAGQIALSQAWAEALGRHGIVTGQILITPNITEERRYYLNARTTIATLLSLGAIPIINENDSVATAEIRYGDNDRLSARVATMVESDCLVLLSDIDGLYTAPPAKDPGAEHIPMVKAITPAIEAMAGGAASHLSRGGMTTKVEAGKIATLAGTAMIIAKGTEPHPLRALTEGGRHTLFQPSQSRAQARKRWIMGSLAVAGTLQVDAGAARALLTGKSLLPIGVTKVSGEFERGD
ncbi:MAG TPA: glutamate 5-kinase, partial [Devosia sp.]|nr:glutamate 5-kinase [Devosia sp.]